MTSTTTYATVHGVAYGLTPIEREGELFVWITTKHHDLGLYLADRFGPDPITPAGRVRASAVRAFESWAPVRAGRVA